jgi:DNA invertase Pin-like site-specific DNA recombinase
MKQIDSCAIILVRVSTYVQDYQPQVDDLINYAKKLGYNKFEKIDTKETGLADLKNKEGFERLKSFVKNNPNYKTVFATELSRIGRRQSVLHQIKEWFVSNKIQLHLKDTGYSLFDSDGNVSAAGEIMFTLFGYFAESEVKTKKERFLRAKKHLMSIGLSISGKTLFGYKKEYLENQKSTLVPDENNSAVVKKIFQWYIYGFENKDSPSIRDISLKCLKENLPTYTHSKRNVNKLLKEEGYTGFKITNNKRKNPSYIETSNEEKYIVTQNEIKYPQIIDKETFELAQQKLKSNNTTADKSNKHTTILARLIVCPLCGNYLIADYRIKDNIIKNTYRCSGRNKTIPCRNKQVISMNMLDSAIWSLIKTDLKLLSETINKINPNQNLETLKLNKENIEKRLETIDEDIIQLQNGIISSTGQRNIDLSKVIDAFDSRVKKLGKEKGTLHKEILIIEKQFNIAKKKLLNIEEIISKNVSSIENSRELLRRYVNYFVNRIEIIGHNTRYTVLRIHFKTYNTIEKRIIQPDGTIQIPDSEFGQMTYIILDKKMTIDIKAIKFTRKIEIVNEQQIKLYPRTIPIEMLFKMGHDEFEKNPIYKDVKPLKMTNLKLSQNNT